MLFPCFEIYLIKLYMLKIYNLGDLLDMYCKMTTTIK